MNIGVGIIRLWLVASIAWSLSAAAILRVDRTVAKVMGWNLRPKGCCPDMTEAQREALQNVTLRLNSGAGDDLVTQLYVIFVPVVVSLVFAVGFRWVWDGFRNGS